MKRTHYLTAVALLSISLIGCDQKPKAIAFSNIITQTNDSVLAKNFEVAKAAGYCWATKDFSRVGNRYNEFISFIDQKRAEIEKMDDVGGSELKTKELAFLQFEKDLMAPIGTFTSFSATTPEETYTAITNKVMHTADQEPVKLSEINRLLKEYAQKNEIPYEAPRPY